MKKMIVFVCLIVAITMYRQHIVNEKRMIQEIVEATPVIVNQVNTPGNVYINDVKSTLAQTHPDEVENYDYANDVLSHYFDLINAEAYEELKIENNWDVDIKDISNKYSTYKTDASYTVQRVSEYGSLYICKTLIFNDQPGDAYYSEEERFEYEETIVINAMDNTIFFDQHLYDQDLKFDPVRYKDYLIKPIRLENYTDRKVFIVEIENQGEMPIETKDLISVTAQIGRSMNSLYLDQVHTLNQVESGQSVNLYFNLPVYILAGQVNKFQIKLQNGEIITIKR